MNQAALEVTRRRRIMARMTRKAFQMQLEPEFATEYERRHNPIWEELATCLKEHGVSNYSIFIDQENRKLFGYAEVESEERWAAIASTSICRKWWAHMSEIMLSNPDGSPVAQGLREVFHLD